MAKDDELIGEIVDLTSWRECREKEKMREEIDDLWQEFIHVTDQLAAYGDGGALKSSILDPISDIRYQLSSDDFFSEMEEEDEDYREPDY